MSQMAASKKKICPYHLLLHNLWWWLFLFPPSMRFVLPKWNIKRRTLWPALVHRPSLHLVCALYRGYFPAFHPKGNWISEVLQVKCLTRGLWLWAQADPITFWKLGSPWCKSVLGMFIDHTPYVYSQHEHRYIWMSQEMCMCNKMDKSSWRKSWIQI